MSEIVAVMPDGGSPAVASALVAGLICGAALAVAAAPERDRLAGDTAASLKSLLRRSRVWSDAGLVRGIELALAAIDPRDHEAIRLLANALRETRRT